MGNHKAQHGALLIELAIGMAVLTLLAVGTVSWMSQQAEKTKMESLAVAMQSVQLGVQALLDTHAVELRQQEVLDISGIQDWHQPTLSELQQLGFLAPSFSLNSTIRIVLYREGECPGERCYVHALVYSTQPLVNKKQQIDMHAIAHWQGVVQGVGLVVQPRRPMAFVGAQLVIEWQGIPFAPLFPVGSVALLASSSPTLEDMTIGRYLVLPHTERLGASCAPLGAVSRDEEGKGLLVCEQDKWTRAAAETEGDSIEALKQMVRAYWKISIPDHTPGGFFVKEQYYSSFHCWVPNLLNTHTDGRGICKCAKPYSEQKIRRTGAVTDKRFKIGIERPALDVFACV